MKKYLILLAVVLPALVLAQPTPPPYSAGALMSYEHIPLIYESAFGDPDTLDGTGGTLTTRWMHVGASSAVSASVNNPVSKYNPETFTLLAILTSTGDGDSVCIASARFEFAIDTTATAAWNADSTNRFIESGAYDHALYGQWKFEDVVMATPAISYMWPLRIPMGGFVRLVFTTGTTGLADDATNPDAISPDDTLIDWTLWCEN